MRVITFDSELAAPVAEVGGWEGARDGAAGVSCVALYDTDSERFHIYDEHDLEECVDHLNQADMLVGFNCTGFDTPVLESLTGYTIMPPQYDILSEIWRALSSRVKGYRLSDICERLTIGHKTFAGVSAHQLYARKRFGKLFDYCINDVALTRKLSNYINENGYILTPDGEPLEVSRPGVPA